MGEEAGLIPPGLQPVAVFVLVFLAVLGAIYALFRNSLSREAALRTRLELATGIETQNTRGTGTTSEQRRKQSIEKALHEMASRERAKHRAKMTLKMRLNQADLPWSVFGFFLRATALAAISLLVLLAFVGMNFVLALPAAGTIGFVGMNFYVKREHAARMQSFLEEFPNAIDVVTRGVKTGLPLGDCLRAIATEGQEPVRGEFQRILDDLAVGLPMAQALLRLTHRVPIMEANFFAVVVTIQSQLGGNLSEALGNLSRVLRERKMMKEKIKAFSSEAKASGAIIASMPVVVGGILSLTSPDYIGLLFSEFSGNIVLGGCVIWMTTGVLVMRNMIRFDF